MKDEQSAILAQCFRLKLAQRARQIANTSDYDNHLKKMSFIYLEFAADLLDITLKGMSVYGPDEYLDKCISDLAVDNSGDEIEGENND